jgi:hypothetical protein
LNSQALRLRPTPTLAQAWHYRVLGYLLSREHLTQDFLGLGRACRGIVLIAASIGIYGA